MSTCKHLLLLLQVRAAVGGTCAFWGFFDSRLLLLLLFASIC